MKIYTKTGDKGETGLLNGIRVSKSHEVIDACGDLDETNSFIGLARSESLPADLDEAFARIQNDLFDLGSRVAACLGESTRTPTFDGSRAEQLESWIDGFDSENPPLKVFILPGGTRTASLLHVARSVCRRAERALIALGENESTSPLENEKIYLNRLSDLLFVVARLANTRAGEPEIEWKVGG